MLLVFVLGITPKRYLHNVFAKHVDNKVQTTGSKPFQLSVSGFNCDNDNLVAESVFTCESPVFEFPVRVSFSKYILCDISFLSVQEVYASLRGPPVNI